MDHSEFKSRKKIWKKVKVVEIGPRRCIMVLKKVKKVELKPFSFIIIKSERVHIRKISPIRGHLAEILGPKCLEGPFFSNVRQKVITFPNHAGRANNSAQTLRSRFFTFTLFRKKLFKIP